jgi:hypothetical protein
MVVLALVAGFSANLPPCAALSRCQARPSVHTTLTGKRPYEHMTAQDPKLCPGFGPELWCRGCRIPLVPRCLAFMTSSIQRERVILRKISVCSRRNTLGSEVDLFRHAPGKLYAQRVDRSWQRRIPMYPAPLIGSSPSEAPGVRNADGLTSPIKSGDPRRLAAPGVPHAWSRTTEARMTVLGADLLLLSAAHEMSPP